MVYIAALLHQTGTSFKSAQLYIAQCIISDVGGIPSGITTMTVTIQRGMWPSGITTMPAYLWWQSVTIQRGMLWTLLCS